MIVLYPFNCRAYRQRAMPNSTPNIDSDEGGHMTLLPFDVVHVKWSTLCSIFAIVELSYRIIIY